MRSLLYTFTKILNIMAVFIICLIFFMVSMKINTTPEVKLMMGFALFSIFFCVYMFIVIIISYFKLDSADRRKNLLKYIKIFVLFSGFNIFFQLMDMNLNIELTEIALSGFSGIIGVFLIEVVPFNRSGFIKVKPRIENITEFITREEIKSIQPEDNINLPDIILKRVKEIRRITYPKQGRCSLVMTIENYKGKILVKIAKGSYRGKELNAEYLAMKQLKETNVPVPEVNEFFQIEGKYYLAREYVEGSPLSTVFSSIEIKEERLDIINKIAIVLNDIHSLKIKPYEYSKVIENQLYFAEKNYENKAIDLTDFVVDGVKINPKEELEWLKKNKPSQGQVSLIHGDYRPKNILWDNGEIVSIIDWAFCDISDPYYDIAMMFDYLNDDEKRAFIEAYGNELDENRLEYQRRIIPFINI